MDKEIIVFAFGVAVLAVGLLLAWIPGYCARERGHQSAQAINLCGWLSLAMPVLWVVAFIWAHTGPDRSDEVKRRRREAKASRPRGFEVERLEQVYKKPIPMSPAQDQAWLDLMEGSAGRGG